MYLWLQEEQVHFYVHYRSLISSYKSNSLSVIMFIGTDDGKKCEPSTSSSAQSPQSCRQFGFPEILLATENFDESLVIGHGGFLEKFTKVTL
ncbi:hypothetical protein Hanom_Chr03g00207311 [Helianthus anomalus]